MLTQAAIDGFKDYLDREIAFAKVTVNGETRQIPIHRRDRLADGRVAVYLEITPQMEAKATITRVQLFNRSKELWADKAENIALSNVQEGALYRFVFKIEEQEV